jgi:hypothetical protein
VAATPTVRAPAATRRCSTTAPKTVPRLARVPPSPAPPRAAPRPLSVASPVAVEDDVFSPARAGAADVLLMIFSAGGQRGRRRGEGEQEQGLAAGRSRRASASRGVLQFGGKAEADAADSKRRLVSSPEVTLHTVPGVPRDVPSRVQKTHRPWSSEEVEALIAGVQRYGRGQWADIKAMSAGGVASTLAARSAVDCKARAAPASLAIAPSPISCFLSHLASCLTRINAHRTSGAT